MEAYLDNSATTKPCKAAIDKILDTLNFNYGNPSSQHSLGLKSLNALKETRETVAKSLFCQGDEIYFAPSGTIANNVAIFGAMALNKKKQHNIVTTAIEHPSVIEPIKHLESKGANVTYLKVDKNGRLCNDELFNAIDKNTTFISIMAVNNEVGTINPLSIIKSAIKRTGSPALVHSDAVQAFGKINISPKDLGVDLLTISSHKIHGGKGAAALYVKKGIRLANSFFGGGQEKGLFSGTEDMPALAGFAAAIKSLPPLNESLKAVKELRDYAAESLKQIDDIYINSPEDALPYILNISVASVPSEVLVNYLSSEQVYISAGSACKRGHKSHVIKAMGLAPQRLDSAVRISFSRFSKKEEVNLLIEKIQEAVKKFRI